MNVYFSLLSACTLLEKVLLKGLSTEREECKVVQMGRSVEGPFLQRGCPAHTPGHPSKRHLGHPTQTRAWARDRMERKEVDVRQL